ncbi:BlaI/MecI/CopY family transcriptional regulator [Planctomicrobium piriforme]|uniref:Predicted transcriptional regulator n=1 Tax=Planctomicrobium piriforme TaxID=1576369 RepID=A0A1I3C836_9PLAN|nr:BlaI/MecI/CopY family transcriptional regulator [Planctomicrobium piriforme]SFH70667.1 Predicted transcriptional regulator [Planctomicrobium piriforme]
MRLTRCEVEIMNAVWHRGTATVQEVCDALDRPLAYSTVMTMLRILETKRQALERVKRGRAYVYRPLVSREEISHELLAEVRDDFFGGSVKSLMLNLIGGEQVSASDIRELKAALSQLERET